MMILLLHLQEQRAEIPTFFSSFILKTLEFYTKTVFSYRRAINNVFFRFIYEVCNENHGFIIYMMDFITTVMDFIMKMMNFIMKTMDFIQNDGFHTQK